jgi:hypothetical protein
MSDEKKDKELPSLSDGPMTYMSAGGPIELLHFKSKNAKLSYPSNMTELPGAGLRIGGNVQNPSGQLNPPGNARTVEIAWAACKAWFAGCNKAVYDMILASQLRGTKQKTLHGKPAFRKHGLTRTFDEAKWNACREDVMEGLLHLRFMHDPLFRTYLRDLAPNGFYHYVAPRGAKKAQLANPDLNYWGGFTHEGVFVGRNTFGKLLERLAESEPKQL